MVTVSVSETFDLSTKLGKMTLIGIHTPKKELIQKMYPGFAMQYKYFRINSVSVIMAGVTGNYAISPQDIGVADSQIAPEDMLNPILFKAVSNNSWSTMEARLAGLGYQIQNGGEPNYANPKIVGDMAFTEDDSVVYNDNPPTDEFGVYYSLLSDPAGFRLGHISKGVQMKNLRPLVYEKWYSHGVNGAHGIAEVGDGGGYERVEIPPREFLGKAHRMPKINTTYLTGVTARIGDGEVLGENMQSNGMDDGLPRNVHCKMPDIEPVMCGMILLPPCRRTKMFYRMVVRASISFFGKRPMTEVTSFSQMDTELEPILYHSDYADQSSKMEKTTDFVDVANGNIEKIMEGH